MIRGESVLQGYLSDKGINKKYLNSSFFDTKDKGCIDHNGELVFVGRDGESIVVNSNNIFFEDIEDVIKKQIKLNSVCYSLEENKLIILLVSYNIDNNLNDAILDLLKKMK